jgi:hypothetical protein
MVFDQISGAFRIEADHRLLRQLVSSMYESQTAYQTRR